MIPFAPGFFNPRPQEPIENLSYLVSLFVGGFTAGVSYNKDDISNPNYAAYQASPAWMFYAQQMSFGGSDSYTNAGPVVQDYFVLSDRLRFTAFNRAHSLDAAEIDIEFQTASDVTRAALRCRRGGDYITTFQYGETLASLSSASGTGSFPCPDGHLTFTSSSLIFTNAAADHYRNSFTLGSLTMSDVAKIKYTSAYVLANSISGASNAVILLLRDTV